jgi:hypothetical protein
MALADRYVTALRKRAKKGFRGYPVATIAYYGPDDRRATKVAVGIVLSESRDIAHMERWFSDTTDVRTDPQTAKKLSSTFSSTRYVALECLAESSAARTKRELTIPRGRNARNVRSGQTAIAGLERRCSEPPTGSCTRTRRQPRAAELNRLNSATT